MCAEKDPVYIVMEFMPGGAFLDFLRKKGCNQTKKKLCGMVVDACQVRNEVQICTVSINLIMVELGSDCLLRFGSSL